MLFSVVSPFFVLLSILSHKVSSFTRGGMRFAKDSTQISKFPLRQMSEPKSNVELANESVLRVGFQAIGAIASSLAIGAATSARAEEASVKKPKKVKVLETSNLGIKYIDVKKGEGAYPQDGDFIVIDYIGFLSDGTVFDSTEGKGKKKLSFRFGKKQVIPGIEDVLESMQAGGERTCTIPPKYAYGEKGVCLEGSGCLVPPNETLKYVIKLRQVGAGYN